MSTTLDSSPSLGLAIDWGNTGTTVGQPAPDAQLHEQRVKLVRLLQSELKARIEAAVDVNLESAIGDRYDGALQARAMAHAGRETGWRAGAWAQVRRTRGTGSFCTYDPSYPAGPRVLFPKRQEPAPPPARPLPTWSFITTTSHPSATSFVQSIDQIRAEAELLEKKRASADLADFLRKRDEHRDRELTKIRDEHLAAGQPEKAGILTALLEKLRAPPSP